MISSNLKQRQLTHRLIGDGNLDTVIHTLVEGFFRREVSLLERVRAGQRLGAILDASGAEQAAVEADQDGAVIMLRGLPHVRAVDGIAHITQLDHLQ